MINFVFYKYELNQLVEQTLFGPGHVEVTEDYLNGRIAEDLETKYKNKTELNLYEFKKNKKGEEYSESYTNDVSMADNGIFIIQVRNNKHKTYMPIDQNVAQEVGHYPFCWVLVDTRPESKSILVQLKHDAFGNPDDVVALITTYLTRELGIASLNWAIKTTKRLCVGSIWDIVRIRTDDDNDRVKTLSITVDKKRANDNNEVDKALQLILDKLAAPEGEFKVASDDEAHKILDESKEDVRNIVDMLIENKYRMKVGFNKSGTVEYGKDTEAIYGVDDEVINQFAGGESVMLDSGKQGYRVVPWLDMVTPDNDSHTYIVAEKKKKNGRGRKK